MPTPLPPEIESLLSQLLSQGGGAGMGSNMALDSLLGFSAYGPMQTGTYAGSQLALGAGGGGGGLAVPSYTPYNSYPMPSATSGAIGPGAPGQFSVMPKGYTPPYGPGVTGGGPFAGGAGGNLVSQLEGSGGGAFASGAGGGGPSIGGTGAGAGAGSTGRIGSILNRARGLAGEGGAARGFLGRLGANAGTRLGSLSIPEGVGLGAGLKGIGSTLGRAGVTAGGYYAVGQVAGQLLGGSDTQAGNAASKAGTGAALGFMIAGPEGAAAGAVLGGLYGWLDSGDSDGSISEQAGNEVLNQLLDGSGLSADYQRQLHSTFDIVMATGLTNESGQQVIAPGDVKGALAIVGQQMTVDLQTQQQINDQIKLTMAQREADAKYQIQLQAETAKYFKPFADQIMASANAQAQSLQANLGQVPEEYRGILATQTANQLSSAQRIATAYMAQAQLLPAYAMLQQNVQNQADVEKYQWQSLVLQAQMGNSSGAQSTADVLSGVTP